MKTDIHVTVYESKTGSIIDENERVPGPCECDPTERVRQVEEKQQGDQRTEPLVNDHDQ